MATVNGLKLPVGFRFHPTEVELVTHYLQKKIQGLDSHARDIIADIEICKIEPWDLHAYSVIKSDDDEWFFFSRPEYIPNKKDQIKRSTNEGSWKITGKDREIKARGRIVGKKRTMTFYRGRKSSREKTNWVIHEYYIPQTSPNAKERDIVLCRLKKKPDENTAAATRDEGEPGHDMDIQVHYTPSQENRDYFEREGDRLLASADSNNGNRGLQSGFGDSEPVDGFEEFMESLIVDPDQGSYEETRHITLFNDVTLPQSLMCVDAGPAGGESSDSDTEAPSAQDKLAIGHSTGFGLPRRETDGMLHEWSDRAVKQCMDAASDDEATPTFQINSSDFQFNEYYSNESARRSVHSPRGPIGAVKLRQLKQRQDKAKEAAKRPTAATNSERPSMSNKDTKVTKGKGSEKGMKQTESATTASNWKGSFISWETSLLTSPPSVYIFNAVLGTILFMVFAREVVLYGNWG